MKKILFLLLIVIFCSVLKADKIKNKIQVIDTSEESAVSINSEEQYRRLQPKNVEPQHRVRSLPLFDDPGHPWVRSRAAKDRETGRKIAQLAVRWLQARKKFVIVNGKRTTIYNDCSNFVRAVYWHIAGIDIMKEAITSGAARKQKVDMTSGCSLIYSYFKVRERIGRRPRIGDIVFFDNTWDRNRNRKWDDPLTHVGIVTGYSGNGSVTFVHANTGRPKKIREAYLNLKYPSDKRKNTYLKVKYTWDRRPKLLAGQIMRGFGGFSFTASGNKKFSDNKSDTFHNDRNDKKRKPDNKRKKSEDHDNILLGKWRLVWKNRNGRYSYIFRKRVVELYKGGSGRYTSGDATSPCFWQKKKNSIIIYVNREVVENFIIVRCDQRELLVITRNNRKQKIQLMFNKE